MEGLYRKKAAEAVEIDDAISLIRRELKGAADLAEVSVFLRDRFVSEVLAFVAKSLGDELGQRYRVDGSARFPKGEEVKIRVFKKARA